MWYCIFSSDKRGDGLKELSEVFIPIPNGIIEASIKVNQWILPVYCYLYINKNILGTIDTTVKLIQNAYFTPKNRSQEKENKENIAKALWLLTSNMTNENQDVLYSSLIDINKYENLSEEEITLSEDLNLVESLFNKFGDIDTFIKSFLTIKINYNCSKEKNFTKCSIEEYMFFKNYFSSIMGKDNKNKITGFQLMYSYFLIKATISKKRKFKDTSFFGSGYVTTLSLKNFRNYCQFTSAKAESVLSELEKYKLIAINKNIIDLPN